jgi:hypothetical protein
MVIKKRSLLWDYINTQKVPHQIDKVNFNGPISSVSNWNAWVPPELKGRVPFCPMIHLERELNGQEWGLILQSNEQIVHFFNEPERNGISVDQAAKYWKDQVRCLYTQLLNITTCISRYRWFSRSLGRMIQGFNALLLTYLARTFCRAPISALSANR